MARRHVQPQLSQSALCLMIALCHRAKESRKCEAYLSELLSAVVSRKL